MPDLPVFFLDTPLPEPYVELIAGRALMVGPDDADLARADAIIAGAKRPWNADAFALAERTRVISRVGVGYDNVDVAAATAVGIVVCNTPFGPTVSTAEHTIALMMAIGRELPAQQARAREGLPGSPVGTALEFDERTLGLIGYGRIARRVGAVGLALGMRVVAYDPYISSAGAVELVSLPELLADSDVISLHAPATSETHRLIDAAAMAAMKRGVLLVNCARGGLIDPDALLAALDSGQVGGAGLDVTDPEPLPVGHALLTHPRVIVTPHIASATVAGRRRLYQQAIDNAFDVLAGRPATTVEV